MKNKLLLILLALMTPLGVFSRFEFSLAASVVLLFVFVASVAGKGFDKNIGEMACSRFNLSLVFVFGLVAVSLLNPHAVALRENGYSEIVPQSHIWWLPTSVSAQVGDRGAFAFLLFWLNVFYFANAVYFCSRERGNSVFFIKAMCVVWIAAAAYLVYSAAVVYPQVESIGGKKLFGIISSPRASIMGSFFSRNAAAQFFIVALFCSLGFWLCCLLKNGGGRHSGILPFCAFALSAVALVFCVQAQAMAGLAVGGIAAVCGLLYVARKRGRRGFGWGILSVLVVGIVLSFVAAAHSDAVSELLGDVREKIALRTDKGVDFASDRIAMWKGGVDILSKHRLWGVGANDYVFYSFTKSGAGTRMAYSVHNDVLQMFVEFGVLGGLALLCLIICGVFRVLRGTNRGVFEICFFAGVAVIFAVSLFDMPFRTPNVVWSIFGITAALLAERKFRSD